MKKTLLLILFVLSSSYVYARQGLDIPMTEKFHSSARIVNQNGFTSEKGKINGINYSRHSDGSASFDLKKNSLINKNILNRDHWSVGCSQDAMTDKKSCQISESDSTLFINLEQGQGVTYVSLFSHDFPGRSFSIRVGNAKPITANSIRGQRAKQLVSKLKTGVVVKTRYYSWPYDYPKDGKVVIYGLDEALKYAKWALNDNRITIGNSINKVQTQAVNKSTKPTNSNGNIHSHAGRSHSHPLPAQGKAHKHGNGATGK